jgi:hypothetical protein
LPQRYEPLLQTLCVHASSIGPTHRLAKCPLGVENGHARLPSNRGGGAHKLRGFVRVVGIDGNVDPLGV